MGKITNSEIFKILNDVDQMGGIVWPHVTDEEKNRYRAVVITQYLNDLDFGQKDDDVYIDFAHIQKCFPFLTLDAQMEFYEYACRKRVHKKECFGDGIYIFNRWFETQK